MTKLYTVEIKLCATAYIRAKNKAEALRVAAERYGDQSGDVLANSDNFSGKRFDDPSLPDASLSPCMTAYGLWDGSKPELA